VFVARESGRIDEERLPSELAVSVVTVAELRAGVLAATDVVTRNRRLVTLTETLTLEAMPVDERVAEEWARLRVLLGGRGNRMPVNDSWIAATTMSLQVPVVTQDDDFDAIPEVGVIRV
jgi:predicted nucleic acid-binding protein